MEITTLWNGRFGPVVLELPEGLLVAEKFWLRSLSAIATAAEIGLFKAIFLNYQGRNRSYDETSRLKEPKFGPFFSLKTEYNIFRLLKVFV